MAVWLTLCAECGPDEGLARRVGAAFRDQVGEEGRPERAEEDGAWWAVAHLLEWGTSRRLPREEALAFGDRAYATLASSAAAGYRFALLGWECFEFRTYAELASGDVMTADGMAGLVICESMWPAAGHSGFGTFAPGYRWRRPDLGELILGERDLRRTPGFLVAFQPAAEIVRRDDKDPGQAGIIQDRRSKITVSAAAAKECLAALPAMRHAAAREALLRLLPDGYWQPGMMRILARSIIELMPSEVGNGTAEHDIVNQHLVTAGTLAQRPHQRGTVIAELAAAFADLELVAARRWMLRCARFTNPPSRELAEAVRPLVDDPEVGGLAFEAYFHNAGAYGDSELLSRYSAHHNPDVATRATEKLAWLKQRSAQRRVRGSATDSMGNGDQGREKTDSRG